MSAPPAKPAELLNKMVDVVLAYKPPAKTMIVKKRKKKLKKKRTS